MNDMYNLRKLSIFGMALLSSGQSVCARVLYEMNQSDANPQCSALMDALRRARVAEMSDQQICDVMNSRVTDLLKGKDFSELPWTLVSVSTTSEKEAIAKDVYEARVEHDQLQHFARDESEYLPQFAEGLGRSDVIFEEANLNVGKSSAYALQYRRGRCEAGYKGYDGIPYWAIFADKQHTLGLPSKPYTPPGNLFYLDGRLAVFSILPDRWYVATDIPNKRYVLTVDVQSVDGTALPGGKIQFSTALLCVATIRR